jgi:hypothetical protein
MTSALHPPLLPFFASGGRVRVRVPFLMPIVICVSLASSMSLLWTYICTATYHIVVLAVMLGCSYSSDVLMVKQLASC